MKGVESDNQDHRGAWSRVLLWILLWTSYYILFIPWLMKGLNKISDRCSLSIFMGVMTLSIFKKWSFGSFNSFLFFTTLRVSSTAGVCHGLHSSFWARVTSPVIRSRMQCGFLHTGPDDKKIQWLIVWQALLLSWEIQVFLLTSLHD